MRPYYPFERPTVFISENNPPVYNMPYVSRTVPNLRLAFLSDITYLIYNLNPGSTAYSWDVGGNQKNTKLISNSLIL